MRAAAVAILLAISAVPCLSQEESSSFQNVVVQPGDTLWAISNKYLKDPASWDQILKHNKLPTKDPTVALPGMILRVPVRLIKAQLRAAHLVYSVNRVLYRRKETADWKGGKTMMELFQGDSVRTLEDSKARVKLLDKELLSLEPNSMAVIKPQDRDGDIELKSGSVIAGRARVVTATALVTPKTKDTRYAASVEPDLTTRVEVYKGLAAVDAQGSRVDVPAGMSTRVRPGLAPEVPKVIANLPEIEARGLEFASAIKVGGGAAPEPRGALAAPEPEADAESLRGDLQSLRVGLPIMGYRVQAAKDKEFTNILFDKNYESDDRFLPGDGGLAPGAYWWRIAIVDLLGTEGNFSAPRYYTVGIKRANAAQTADFRKAVTIASPSEDSVVDDDDVKVIGVLRDDRFTVTINDKPIRADEDGNFMMTVRLQPGVNEILINIADGKGNSTSLSRRPR